ncbi:MAG: alpha/beta hydrolase [Balneolaceae bacterium]|nr:alpha/beta hydrolase [Balneolaceae bacterium]
MNNLLWGIAVISALYLGLALLVWAFQERLVYFPQRTLVATPADFGMPYRDVRFDAEDGISLHGWLVEGVDGPPSADRPGAGRTLLFFHGNAGNISGRLETARLFRNLGLDVLMVDYRGYGQSGGRPTEEGTYRDAQAAWDWLTGEEGVPADSVVVMGRSLGGAVAAWLASRVRPRALILESTFTSGVDLARHAYPVFPVNWMLRHRYPTAEHLRGLDIPKLFAHSREDRTVPWQLGRRLYEGAPQPKTFLEMEGGHNDAFRRTGQPYLEAIQQFLSELDN